MAFGSSRAASLTPAPIAAKSAADANMKRAPRRRSWLGGRWVMRGPMIRGSRSGQGVPSAHEQAAVDLDRLPGQVGALGPGEEGDHPSHVLRRPRAAEADRLGRGLEGFARGVARMESGLPDEAGGDAVDAHAV